MVRTAERAYNIELLRILAMVLILLHHIFVHCARVQLTDADSIARMGNGLFCQPVQYERLFVFSAASSWGRVGNDLFILISGYFLVAKGPKVDLSRTAAKLLGQALFALLILIVASGMVGRGGSYTGMVTLSTFGDGKWAWFLGYYFVIVLIGKVWLNGHLGALDRQGYRALLVVAFALVQFSWSAGLLGDLSASLVDLANGIFLYALGGFIRRYDCFGHVGTGLIVLLLAAICALMFLSWSNTVQQAIESFACSEAARPGQTFYQPVETYGNASLCVIASAVCLFELFRRMRVPSLRPVNFLGASTFMVYLIHDNELLYSLWGRTDWISLLCYHRGEFALQLGLQALLAFAAGVLAYVLYRATVARWAATKLA